MSSLQSRKFGWQYPNRPAPIHPAPVNPAIPPASMIVDETDWNEETHSWQEYFNSYMDVRAKQIYDEIKEHSIATIKTNFSDVKDQVVAELRSDLSALEQRVGELEYKLNTTIPDQLYDCKTTMQSIADSTESKLVDINEVMSGLNDRVTQLEEKIESSDSGLVE